MKIIKIVLYAIWLFFIVSLFLLYLIQKEEFKHQDKKENVLLKEIMPNAKMSSEYYQNIMILREKSDCKTIADSIFSNSDFLKNYDESFKKVKTKHEKK